MPGQNTQYITEFHSDIVKAVSTLPAASSYAGYRVWYQNQVWYSDGARWLSATLFNSKVEFIYQSSTVSSNPTLISATTFATANVPRISVVPEELYLRLFQTVAGSGGNNYSITVNDLFGLTGSVGGQPALNTQSISVNTWTEYKWTRAAGSFGSYPATVAIDPANLRFVANGSPGNLLMAGARFDYRRVAT